MRVGIIGGTFNPVTLGHLEIAKIAQAELNYDEIWFMINPLPAYKKEVAPLVDRLAMLKLAVQDKYVISTFEVENYEENSYSYQTFKKLLAYYPEIEFDFIIGSDQLVSLEEWDYIDELVKIINLVAIVRPNFVVNENVEKYQVKLLKQLGLDTSSTEVRLGDFSLVPLNVANYILTNHLYLKERIKKYMSPYRYEHTLRVLEKALELNVKFDLKQVELVALLHDIGKEAPNLQSIMEEFYPEHLKLPVSLHHQYVSAFLANTEFYVGDLVVLEAIECHTTASAQMSELAMLPYMADKLEAGRNLESSRIEKLARVDLYLGFIETMKFVVEDYFLKSNIELAEQTKKCLDYYLKEYKNLWKKIY